MKLIMVMCVRDEHDVIADNLRHHFNHGVAQAIVVDNGSVDGTRDILADLARTAPIEIVDEPTYDFSQGRLMTQMALRARDEMGADWILPNDADEFWVPHSGDLPKSIQSDTRKGAGILYTKRYNMFAGWDAPEDAPWHERMIYRVAAPKPIPTFEDLFKDEREYPHFYCDLFGKVTMQAAGLREIKQGFHQAFFEDDVIQSDSQMTIYHVPVRTRAQFESKACNGGTSLQRNTHLPKSTSWHIRRWYWRYDNLGFEAAIEDAIPSSARVKQDLKAGLVVEDTSLRDLLMPPEPHGRFSWKRLIGRA
ncbi:MAG: glycosyltransferase family 2 protein [Pseudomonadota bacterium]